jgi:hypothetical protein
MAVVSDRGMSQSAEKPTPLSVLCRQLSLNVAALVVKMVVKIMGLPISLRGCSELSAILIASRSSTFIDLFGPPMEQHRGANALWLALETVTVGELCLFEFLYAAARRVGRYLLPRPSRAVPARHPGQRALESQVRYPPGMLV